MQHLFKGERMNLCEVCDSRKGKRRKDDIHVCDKCNAKYPLRKEKNDS